jgi:C-terminal processing protease CtpA/Prc
MTVIRGKFLGVLASWRLNRLCFRKISQILILAVIFSLSGRTLSIAETPLSTQPTVSQHQLQIWIEQLASDDPQTRRTALSDLMSLQKQDLPALRAATVSKQPLLPEQLDAIRQAVTQVFLAGEPYKYATDPQNDTGFLGVQWQREAPSQPPDGVLVWSRIPGFVAYRMLQPGDIIVKILRQPALPDVELHQFDQFTRLVQQLHAGDVLRLRVLRYGRPTDVSIRLDHRPLDLVQDQSGVKIQQWINTRAQAAEDYWNHEFSGIDPVQATSSTQP